MLSHDLRVEPLWQGIWTIVPAPRGPGCVLVAHQIGARTAWVIAPPAVRLRPGETDTLCSQWRAARYDAADLEELFIAIRTEAPSNYQAVTAHDVRAAIPAEFREWVSHVCDRQLALADGFGRQDPRLPPIEAHVRAAATRYVQIAGPAKTSRRAKAELAHAPGDVPDTVDELLSRATGQTRPRSVALWTQRDSDAARVRDGELILAGRVLGHEDLSRLASINDLAEMLAAQGNLDAALNLHEQALAVFQHVLSDDRLGLLASINDLTETLEAHGYPDGARILHEQALADVRQLLANNQALVTRQHKQDE